MLDKVYCQEVLIHLFSTISDIFKLMIKNGGYVLKLKKWRASQATDFFHGVPNKSQGSHLGDQL